MKSAKLRRWMQKYGNFGVLMVAISLVMHSLGTKARRIGLLAAITVLLVGCLVCFHCPERHILDSGNSMRAPMPPRVSTSEVLPPLPSGPVKVALGPPVNPKKDFLSRLSIKAGDGLLWEDDCLYGNASDVPQNRVVYYANAASEIVARRYTGEAIWRRGMCNMETVDVCAGGGAVFVEESGPTWGVMMADIENWMGDEGIVGSQAVSALDSKDGSVLWESNAARVGTPVWTNGKMFVDIRLDVFDADAVKHNRLPVWIEVRSVKDHRRLWHRLLSGYPPVLGEVTQPDSDHVAFHFASAKRTDDSNLTFLKWIRDLSIVVPLSSPNLQAAGHPVLLDKSLKQE